MSESSVSILIPCHNAERWIGAAIESALAQTWPHCEVIVVDDGSDDGSQAVIESFGDRIRFEAGSNRGGNVARNRLCELSTGDWLQFLDADDYLLPNKVSDQLSYAASHPQADVLFGPVTLEHWAASGARREVLEIPEPHDPWILLARWFLPQTGAALWKREAMARAGGWKPDQPCCQEHELYLRALQHGQRFEFCPSGGAVYRQWSADTVCNRDIQQVHRQRMVIVDAAESYLRSRQQLSRPRQRAINQGRFEIARIAWHYSPQLAAEIMQQVQLSEPRFVPGGNAGRLFYRLVYQAFGFRCAERAADWRRRWVFKPRGAST